MSKALQCDRCGEFYKFKPMEVGDIRYDLGIIIKLDNGKCRGRALDLCPKCRSELTMFAIGVPYNEEDILAFNE